MGNYIGKYSTSGDVQTAVDNGVLLKPYVALVGNEIDWNTVSETNWTTIPFTVELMDSTKNSVQLNSNTSIYYKINDGVWTSLSSVITLTTGNTYSFKGTGNWTNAFFRNLSSNLGQELKMYGNIMSLIAGDNFATATDMNGKRFMRIFKVDSTQGTVNYGKPKINITNLVLPATTLYDDCYKEMFQSSGAYSSKPVVLPATTLADGCYQNMFQNCSNLNYIKCLATDISASYPTYNWVSGVASSGTFVTPSTTSWTTGTSGIPSGWTRVNSD